MSKLRRFTLDMWNDYGWLIPAYIATVCVLAVAVGFLVAGISGGGSTTVAVTQDPLKAQVVKYRGFELHCVGDSACDFTRFYAEHPELLTATPK